MSCIDWLVAVVTQAQEAPTSRGHQDGDDDGQEAGNAESVAEKEIEHQAACLRGLGYTVEIGPVGRNDFGMPEDRVVPIVIPLRVPNGGIFRNCRTGDVIDSDGRLRASWDWNTI